MANEIEIDKNSSSFLRSVTVPNAEILWTPQPKKKGVKDDMESVDFNYTWNYY